MRNFSDKSCRENKKQHFVFSSAFWKACGLWDNVEKYCRAGRKQMTIWRMRIACCTPKVTKYTLRLWNTGRFIMFSVITNIYNKKTKGPTLMELFTATGKLKKFFLTTRDVRCVHHGWHGTHRYDIQVLSTHASTWVHRYSSLLQWSVPLGQRGHVAMVGRTSTDYHARFCQ
jgi:hypothetical protein